MLILHLLCPFKGLELLGSNRWYTHLSGVGAYPIEHVNIPNHYCVWGYKDIAGNIRHPATQHNPVALPTEDLILYVDRQLCCPRCMKAHFLGSKCGSCISIYGILKSPTFNLLLRSQLQLVMNPIQRVHLS